MSYNLPTYNSSSIRNYADCKILRFLKGIEYIYGEVLITNFGILHYDAMRILRMNIRSELFQTWTTVLERGNAVINTTFPIPHDLLPEILKKINSILNPKD